MELINSEFVREREIIIFISGNKQKETRTEKRQKKREKERERGNKK